MANIITSIRKKYSENPLLIIGVFFIIIIILLAIIITIFDKPANNHQLNKDEARLQRIIQQGTNNSDILLNNVIISDGNWSLVQINLSSDRTNYAMAIINNDKIVIGPGTLFELKDLIKSNVSDKIIDYLYPSKPQWAGFGAEFNSIFPYSKDQVKFIITSFARQQNITVNRVIMTDDGVSHNVENPVGNNRIEIDSFNFTLNDKSTIYTFRSIYNSTSNITTYDVLDKDGNVLFTQSVSL